MTRFDRFMQEVLDAAAREAREDASSATEAHHLLLAIAGSEDPTTRRLLASVGLDRAALRAALDQETEQSLAAAGVTLGPSGVPRPSRAREGAPPLGASVKVAVERGLGADVPPTGPQPAHLLLGIVRAPVGTVPRALVLAGVDRDALVAAIRQTLSNEADQPHHRQAGAPR
jgi:ATP-dependent Clp protease ATP-binding subunit ClpA